MRVTIVFVAIIGLCSGQSGKPSSSQQCFPSIWILPTLFIPPCLTNQGNPKQDISGNITANGSVVGGQTVYNDKPTEDNYHKVYLKVCQPPVSKTVEMDVQATLESSTDLADRLAQAIDQNDTQALLQLMSDWKALLPQKNAAIEGTVMAAITWAEDEGIPNDQRRCTQRMIGQLQLFFKLIKEVQRQTLDALVILKQDLNVDNMIKYSEYFKAFLVQLDQFLADPSQHQRLDKPCTKQNNTQLMILIVDNLETMAKDLKKKDGEVKATAVLSTTGLMSQAIAFNAVCHGAENVNNSEMDQEQSLTDDTDLSKKSIDKLELIIRDIIQRKSILKRIFGY